MSPAAGKWHNMVEMNVAAPDRTRADVTDETVAGENRVVIHPYNWTVCSATRATKRSVLDPPLRIQ